jgi:hypothetical protein
MREMTEERAPEADFGGLGLPAGPLPATHRQEDRCRQFQYVRQKSGSDALGGLIAWPIRKSPTP